MRFSLILKVCREFYDIISAGKQETLGRQQWTLDSRVCSQCKGRRQPHALSTGNPGIAGDRLKGVYDVASHAKKGHAVMSHLLTQRRRRRGRAN